MATAVSGFFVVSVVVVVVVVVVVEDVVGLTELLLQPSTMTITVISTPNDIRYAKVLDFVFILFIVKIFDYMLKKEAAAELLAKRLEHRVYKCLGASLI